jgi:hypothetical protein
MATSPIPRSRLARRGSSSGTGSSTVFNPAVGAPSGAKTSILVIRDITRMPTPGCAVHTT